MNKDEKAKENLGLVYACAKRFKGRGIEYDDLFQAGCLGLIKAIDNFDEERGVCFSTYAVPVILGEMKRLFRDGGTVKVGRSLKELSLKVSREVVKFTAQHGREPRISELSEIMSESPEKISETLNAGKQPISLTINDEEGESQIDVPVSSPEEKLTEILSLRQHLEELNEQDKKLIYLRFFSGQTQTRTAIKLNMTQVQVSRREKKIIENLRKKMTG